MTPVISIVIPAFNAESTVSALIEDCMAQTYGNIEVVCVDDGSDDGTFATMEDMSRRYANVRALSIEHGGPTAARAAGAELARGEWIIFADADDRVDPSWIESLVAGMARTDPRGEADIVAGASCWNRTLMNPGPSDAGLKTRWNAASGLFSRGPHMDEVWERLFGLSGSDLSLSHSMCDKLFRAPLARRVLGGIDRSVRIGEDTCFNLVAFARARAVALTYATGYRWSETQHSLSRYPRCLRPAGQQDGLLAC